MTPRLKLDLREAESGYVTTMQEELKKCLVSAGLFRPGLLYRGVSGSAQKVRNLELYGTDHPNFDTVYLLRHDEVFSEDLGVELTLFDYIDRSHPTIAVFDETKVIERTKEIAYKFKDPKNKLEALIAILDVVWGHGDLKGSAYFAKVANPKDMRKLEDKIKRSRGE